MLDFDRITGFYERALDGVTQRQTVIGHNVANQSTPGYKAQRVQFEEALVKAVKRGDRFSDLGIPVVDDPAEAGPTGNNVNLEYEWMMMEQNRLIHSVLTKALGGSFSSMLKAIRGR
jgi:flagellar basal-body rod protein FlgB